jgi:hypothetical protein
MTDALPDLAEIELDISVSSPEPPDRIEELRRVWLERCPIYLAIAKPNAVTVRLSPAKPAAQTAT